ncbi:MAG: hypothetical protein RLZZ387_5012 [Chloroflexota bacterium]|jgi:ParB family chromosome partitioning protein
MTRKRGGLGSGLGALIPNDSDQQPGVRSVPVDSIRQNPRQPRTQFDEEALTELAASIREHGIIQPLIVSESEPGSYLLVAGERRWRASQRAGLERVPVIIRETSPQQLLELALIENVQRADLNPLEEAHAFQALKDEFGLSDDEIAKRLAITSRVTVTNTRRLLRLPDPAKAAIVSGQISAGHGRAILKLEGDEQQIAALHAILDGGLNVRDAERLGETALQLGGDVAGALERMRAAPAVLGGRDDMAAAKRPRPATSREEQALSADDQAVQREMMDVLGTPVRLSRTEKELRVTITFYDDEKLQEFFDLLNSAR